MLSKPDESWQGLSGHITDHLKTDFSDAKNASVYMCGNQKMSDEAIEVLTTAGCPKERIFHESYG